MEYDKTSSGEKIMTTRISLSEAEAEKEKLIKWYLEQEDLIAQKAIEEGNWIPALDANKELFKPLKEEFNRRLSDIAKKAGI